MRILTVLQIGDIHFPENGPHAVAADHKDTGVAGTLVRVACPSLLQNAVRALLKLRHERGTEIAGLLMCGDLTSAGSIPDYEQCVAYLNRALQFSDADAWQRDQLHVVPGNHDVDRPQCDPLGTDVFAKFAALETAWNKINLAILAPRECRATVVSNSSHTAALFSLNSCLGCGELRMLPDSIKDKVWATLKQHIETLPPEEHFTLVGEQLDTPVFSEEHVTDLVERIDKLDSDTVAIVVAHHNLLPQHLVRIAPYTEVLNAGMVRARLKTCARPVLYCHGHIHSTLVEVVSDQRTAGGIIAAIAAPQLADGFNAIELHFARTGKPLGCIVISYRISRDHGGAESAEHIRVPFWSPRDIHIVDEELTRHLWSCLTGRFVTFTTLREQVGDARGSRPQQNSLAEAVSDLEWLGLVDIHNREQDFDRWQVKRNDLS